MTLDYMQQLCAYEFAPIPVFVVASLGARLIVIGSGVKPASCVRARKDTLHGHLLGQFTGDLSFRFASPDEVTALEVCWRLGGMECCWARLRERGLA